MFRTLCRSSLVLLAAVAAAQGEGAAPDAREILKKANAAAASLDALSYEVQFFGQGAIADRVPKASGKVIAQRTMFPDKPRVRIECVFANRGSAEGAPVRFASDGTNATRLEDSRKAAVTGKSEDAQSPEMSALVPPKFFTPGPFELDLRAPLVTHEGTAKVGGVDCDVVKVSHQPSGETFMTYWFGEKDHLLRRIENKIQFREPGSPNPQSGAIVFEVTHLDAQPKINGETFAIDVPEGYAKSDFGPKPQVGGSGMLAAGGPAPEWELPTFDGGKLSLKGLRGKVVILDFWASWCGPCKLAMPGMEKLHQRVKNMPVAVVGINCRQRGKPISEAREVVENLKITYTQCHDGDDVALAYHVGGIPCLYVIDPEGKIVWSTSGWQPNHDEMLYNMAVEVLKAHEKKKADEAARADKGK